MKSIKCKIGLHDWETLNREHIGLKSYEDRICMRCNKVDNSYTKIGRPLRLERKAKALNLWRKCNEK